MRFWAITCKSAEIGGCHSLFFSILCTALEIAGWSSLAARRAHNPKVVGSNPAPATKSLVCSLLECGVSNTVTESVYIKCLLCRFIHVASHSLSSLGTPLLRGFVFSGLAFLLRSRKQLH